MILAMFCSELNAREDESEHKTSPDTIQNKLIDVGGAILLELGLKLGGS